MSVAEVPKSAITIDDFPGLQLEVDEFSLPPGATHEQTNCTSEDIGVLKSRDGYRFVVFEND
jgi:hypothetical protein